MDYKGHAETFRNDGNVVCLDCGKGFKGVYVCQS